MNHGPPQRFTLDGSDRLETRLARICDDVHVGVSAVIPPAQLQAILLGGGYGRGEGGVLRNPEGDQPYNDLEFYVFTRGNALLDERRFRRRLHALGERLSPEAGLEVEFKVLTFSKLRRSPPSMFYYDLLLGHRWIVGDDELLQGCEPHRDPSRLPLHEATRLLMNRCTGLLFSAERLTHPTFTEADADFVGRNLAKARLAFGDVYLTALGQYHWSCRERHRRLLAIATSTTSAPNDLEAPNTASPTPIQPSNAPPSVTPPRLLPDPALQDLLRLHAAGIDFKLHPVRSALSRQELSTQHAEISGIGLQLWLWLEQRRLGTRFASARDYARSRVNKCPETSAFRSLLINLRTHGLRIPLSSQVTRYPRERLLNSLPLLLWDQVHPPAPELNRQLRRELLTRASNFPRWVTAYARLWHRFN